MSIYEVLEQNILNKIHTKLIGTIKKIDNIKRIATVEILQQDNVNYKTKQDIQSDFPLLEDIPIFPIFYSKKLKVWFPYSINDKVELTIFEKSIYEALTSNTTQPQAHFNKFDLTNVAITKALADLNTTQNKAESIYIETENSTIELTAKEMNIIFSNINIESEVNITGNVEINGNLNIKGNIETTGNIKIGGNLEVTGKSKFKETEVTKLDVLIDIFKNFSPYNHP